MQIAFNALQAAVNLVGHEDWVNAFVVERSMAAPARDFNQEPVGGRPDRPGRATDFSKIYFRHDVQRENSVNFRTFKHAGANHARRAVKPFFRRLENEFYLSLNFILQPFENQCGAQAHGNMGVVPAGMHYAGIA